MIVKLLIILKLLWFVKCYPLHGTESLQLTLDRTTEFFANLKIDYASQPINSNTLETVNNEINYYIRNETEPIIRHRRHVQNYTGINKDVDVLARFQDDQIFDFPNVQDFSIFPFQSGPRLLWLVATVNSSGVSLLQIKNNSLHHIDTYPERNSVKIIADDNSFGTFLILQKLKSITVLRLIQDESVHTLYLTQYLETPDEVTHTSIWRGMNQLFLGISTWKNIFIYTWLGEHFDLIQTLKFGATRFMVFDKKGFMHLAATGLSSRILKFSLNSNKFAVTQKLPTAFDITSFYVKQDHFEEHFLSTSVNSTVLYKEMYDRFLPFQKLDSPISVSLTIKNRILLFSLENNTVSVYQYNGWKFVRLNVRLLNVKEVSSINLHGNNLLIVRYENDRWELKGFSWTPRKSLESLRDEMKFWCAEAKIKAKRVPEIPELKKSVRILNGHIGRLRAKNVNGEEDLKNLTKQHEEAFGTMKKETEVLKDKVSAITSRFKTLRAKKVRVKCRSVCKIHSIDVKTDNEHLGKLRNSQKRNRTVEFRNVRVEDTNDLPILCPLPGFVIENMFVNKSINGMSFADLQENALRLSGDQKISGKHVYRSLKAKKASVPFLSIASQSTKQLIQVDRIKAKELFLTNEAGFLLPLNGSATMTGSMKAAKVSLKGVIDLRGRIKGEGVESLSPLRRTSGSLTFNGDYTLRDIKVENTFQAKTLGRPNGKSLNDILTNSVSLDSNVSTHLILQSNKTKWSNVLISDYNNLVTARSNNTVIISGRKYVPRNVTVTKQTYSDLPMPKLETQLCAKVAVATGIKLSTITVDRIIAKHLKIENIFGARELNNTVCDTATSVETIDLSVKRFIGKVNVTNATVSDVAGIDMKKLEKFMDNWTEPNTLKGPIQVTNLTVNTLRAPVRFNIPLPAEVRNVIFKKEAYVGRINNVDVKSFMDNVVKVNDMVSLGSITFSGGLSSDNVHASNFPQKFVTFEENLNLQAKRISGVLETYQLNLPYAFPRISNDSVLSYIIEGSIVFPTEPKIENINNVNLQSIMSQIWLRNETTVLSNSNIRFNDITLKGNNTINSIVTPFGPWANISRNLLSKTKSQEISVPVAFTHLECASIVGSNTSSLKSASLNDLLENTLLRNKSGIVRGKWRFDELHISDNLEMNGKVNNMDLTTDVVRRNAEKNIVTGKKTVIELNTRNLSGMNFSSWAKNAVTKQKRELVVIKGQKTFNNITITDLSLFGRLMGRRIEDALLKSTTQQIYGSKIIRGSLSTSALITDGLINDVNLTSVIDYQIKKRKPVQKIKTKISFQESFEVLGNVTVNGLFQGVELHDLRMKSEKLDPIMNRLSKLTEIADGVDTALQNRAHYMHKLEIVETDIAELVETLKNSTIILLNDAPQCETQNTSLFCNGTRVLNFATQPDLDNIKTMKLISLNNTPFLIEVKSDSISIYTINNLQELHQTTGLHVPGIRKAIVESAMDTLWIILQLSEEMLLLRYEPWSDFCHFVLPRSDFFATTVTPDNQFLLLRSDGLWNLKGLTSPRHIFKMDLDERTETFARGPEYYIKFTTPNDTTLLKARYVGN